MALAESTRTFTESARRAQIVQAAIETISHLGFAGASYAQIAKHAGLSSTGLISYHFAGKDELIELIVQAVTDTASAAMLPRIEAASGGPARLRAYIESNLEWMATHRDHIVAVVEIFNAGPRGPHGQPGRYAAHHRRVIAELDALLCEGQRTDELRTFSTHVMALSIRAVIDAAGYQLASEPELDIVTVGHEIADLFDRATRNVGPSRKVDLPPEADHH